MPICFPLSREPACRLFLALTGAISMPRPGKRRGLTRSYSGKTKSFDGASSKCVKKTRRGSAIYSGAGSTKYALLACGSFNPITNMHLRMFEVARDYLERKFNDCEVSRGLISPVSDGYGKQGLECSKHRLKMCCLATRFNSWLETLSWESDQDKWTPTVEVLRNTKNYLEAQGDHSNLLLLCGSDFLESFSKPGLWKDCDVKEILQDYGVVVVQRPGFDCELSVTIKSNRILHNLKDNIHIVSDLISNNTSSTLLRQALRKKQSIKYLTPDTVVSYIDQHHLFATEESESKNSEKDLAPYHANTSAV